MKLSIRHDTTYSYADEVCTSIQFLRLTPRDTQRQRILEWHLELPRLVRSQVDPYGNILHVMTMDEPHGALVLTAYGQVEIDQTVEMEGDSQSPLPFLRTSRLTQADDVLSAFAVEQCGARRDRAALTDLMNGLAARMPYSPGTTAVNSTAAEAFAGGAGCARTTPMRSWPARAAWGSRPATSPVTCAPKTKATWRATPGRKPGWTTAGTAST